MSDEAIPLAMRYKVSNPLPLAARLKAIAREEGTRAALGRVATYGRLRLAQSSVGRAVGFGQEKRSIFPLGATWAHLAQSGVFFGATPEMTRSPHLAIIATKDLPQCNKYRLEQMKLLVERAGIAATIADQRDADEAVTALQMASHAMFYRVSPNTLSWMYLYEARRLGLPTMYDIDDPIFSVPAIAGAAAHLPASLARHFADEAPGILAFMAACDTISVSTEALAQEVQAFLPRPVFVRRNFADTDHFAPLTEAQPPVRRSQGITLALASGSDGRGGDLEPVIAPIEGFLAGDPDRSLILIGHGLDGQGGIAPQFAKQIKRAPFQDYPLYLRQLAEADAVLVPLADDPFNACKSAVRVLDAAAVARPVIASPMGDMCNVVEHGQTGWLAATSADWSLAFNNLAALSDRGASLGQSAQARLAADWSDPLHPGTTDPRLVEWLLA